MPLGNSITWGKSDGAPPDTLGVPPEFGYRDHLIDEFLTDFNMQLVGSRSNNYPGWFQDGAEINEFFPDSVMNVVPELTTHQPAYILVHLGTNNIAREQHVGSPDEAGSVMDELDELMTVLLDPTYNVKQIFLCKIIPRSPYNEFLSWNARIVDYNTQIDAWWNSLSTANQDLVTIVDMFAPFYDNQETYYNTDTDNTHPNPTGYVEMARVFANHIKDYIRGAAKVDEFERAGLFPDSLLQDASNGWVAADSIRFHKVVDEDPGGALYSDAITQDWLQLAIWDTTRGLNSATLRLDPSSANDPALLSGVGMLIGMDTTVVDTASADAATGYMVHVRNQRIDIYTIVDGRLGVYTGESSIRVASTIDDPSSTWNYNYSPGSEFTVTLVIDGDDRIFHCTLGTHEERLIHTTTGDIGRDASGSYGKYAGIIFRGGTGDPNAGNAAMIDWFQARSRQIDVEAPSQITDLQVTSTGNTSATLWWTAPGGDNDDPDTRAVTYDLRYSTSPLDSINYYDASVFADVPVPNWQGTPESVTINGLLSGVNYYFAIVATDAWGNSSPLSPNGQGTTTAIGETVDNFDDGILDGWHMDQAAEYDIDPATDELRNTLSTQEYGSTLIYTQIRNPVTVKMKWGANADNPASASDLENGGVVVLADDTTNADGYFIFVRTALKWIYLFDITWVGPNRILTQLDAVPYDLAALGGYPNRGDSLAVVVDLSNDDYNKFNVYANLGTGWKPASRFALFDDRGEAQRHGTVEGEDYYAGLILSRYSGIRNNNVAAFKLTGELAGVSTITPVHPVGMIYGTVDQELPTADSLTVLVEDDNSNPLPDIPVYFRVSEGGGDLSNYQPPDNHIRLEAEWGDLQPLVNAYDDLFASGGQYVTSQVVRTGAVSLQFNVDVAGTYYFWGRWNNIGRNPPTLNRYATGFQLLQGEAVMADFTWHVLQSTGTIDNWTWVRTHVQDNPNPWSVSLSAGVYTLRIYTAHPNLYLDKVLIANNPAYEAGFSDPLEPDGAILTNHQGQAKTAWTLGTTADDPTTLGTNEGLNVVTARAVGTTAVATFEATGVSAAADSIVQNAYSQTGAAGDSVELGVTIYDGYGNRFTLQNENIDFTLESEDGSLSAATVATDANGEASTYLRLGVSSLPYTVTAKLTDTKFVVFEVTVSSGFVDAIQSQTADRDLYVGDIPHANYLQVKVLNDQGQPVDGVPVTFSVFTGQGYVTDPHVGVQPKITDASGIARDTLWIGASAGIVKIMAASGQIQATVVEDSIFYNVYAITQVFNSGQIINVNSTSQHPIRALITQKKQLGQPAVGVPVRFKTNGHGFRFPNGSETIDVLTDGTGKASTHVVAGPVHGQYPHILEISCTNGFVDVVGSPHTDVILTARSDAQRLQVVSSNDTLEGIVGQVVEEPLQVKMVNINGQPVGGQPVTFIRKAGDGQIEGWGSEATVYTHATTGVALVYYRLGAQAGMDNIVEIQATNGVPSYYLKDINGETVKFHVFALSSEAHAIAAVDDDTLFAGAIVGQPQTARVRVEDDQGNPVGGEMVRFSVMSGGGILNGTADTTKVVTTDVDGNEGIATVEWTLGTQSGVQNRLYAISTNGVDTLSGSPVRFFATPGPDAVNGAQSTVTATSPVYAVPDSVCEITITLRDQYDNAVPNQDLELVVTGGSLNSLAERVLTTNAQGMAYGELTSQTAGKKRIRVVVDGDTLSTETTAIFLASDAARLEYVAGGTQSNPQIGNVGTVLDDSLAVRVTDAAGNPKEFGPVAFEVVSGGGSLLDDGERKSRVQVWSDANGYAWVYYVLGPATGDNLITAASDFAPSGILFKAVGRTSTAATISYVSGRGQVGIAGQELPEPFVVGVHDLDGFPVSGVNVTFTKTSGPGTIVTPMPVTTDMYGRASAVFRSDILVSLEDSWVNATVGGVGSVPFSASSEAGPARNLVYVEGDGQIRQVGQEIRDPLVVMATDQYGNPKEDVPVWFELISGVATFTDGIPVYTDYDGEASMSVELGPVVGPVKIHAKNGDLIGSPVPFTLYANSVTPFTIVKHRGDNQAGTVGRTMVDSLSVRALDEFGNPVARAGVSFYVQKGSGGLLNSQGAAVQTVPVFTNHKGIAAVQYMSGSVPESVEIRALWDNQEIIFDHLQTVNNAYFPVWENKNNVLSSYTVEEGNELILSLRTDSPDGDGDPLRFEIGNLIPPAGARVDSSNEDLWLFRWEPSFTQGRADPYNIYLRVVDGRGGSDGKNVSVYVQNVNRLPTIQTARPAGDTTVVAGQEVRFKVSATDADGDPLHYTWLVDNQPILNDHGVYYHEIDESFTGNRIVTVFVSDQSGFSDPDKGSFRWQLTVLSSVTLADFAAVFEEIEMRVRVRWSTSHEIDNLGFDVFRSASIDGPYDKISTELVPPEDTGDYLFLDGDVRAGRTYYYRLVSLDTRGHEREFGPIKVKVPVPDRFSLSQNYPNPFNPVTRIRYQVPKRQQITLMVFNMMGQRVAILEDAEMEPGYYVAEWDGRDDSGREASTGIYIYRLHSDEQTITKRMVKMR